MTATAFENEQQEQWATEYAAEYTHSIADVLDNGEGFRAKQLAFVQNKDAAEQELAGARREAVLALKAQEPEVEEGYARLLEVAGEFVQVLGSSTAKRDAYDSLWKGAHALVGNDVPRKIPTIGERANASTDEGLGLRRLLNDLRAAKATDLP